MLLTPHAFIMTSSTTAANEDLQSGLAMVSLV